VLSGNISVPNKRSSYLCIGIIPERIKLSKQACLVRCSSWEMKREMRPRSKEIQVTEAATRGQCACNAILC
jgi:hypothetical protein